jgi:hypothetical protein
MGAPGLVPGARQSQSGCAGEEFEREADLFQLFSAQLTSGFGPAVELEYQRVLADLLGE